MLAYVGASCCWCNSSCLDWFREQSLITAQLTLSIPVYCSDTCPLSSSCPGPGHRGNLLQVPADPVFQEPAETTCTVKQLSTTSTKYVPPAGHAMTTVQCAKDSCVCNLRLYVLELNKALKQMCPLRPYPTNERQMKRWLRILYHALSSTPAAKHRCSFTS